MTGKSCFNCKHFEIRDNFFTSTGQKGFITDLKKCGWEYMVYNDKFRKIVLDYWARGL